VFERGQRVDVRDHQWKILDVRKGSHGTLLEVRRLSDGSAAPNLTLVPSLEPDLRLTPAQALRFEIGNRSACNSSTTLCG
jgi:hypothetical protein